MLRVNRRASCLSGSLLGCLTVHGNGVNTFASRTHMLHTSTIVPPHSFISEMHPLVHGSTPCISRRPIATRAAASSCSFLATSVHLVNVHFSRPERFPHRELVIAARFALHSSPDDDACARQGAARPRRRLEVTKSQSSCPSVRTRRFSREITVGLLETDGMSPNLGTFWNVPVLGWNCPRFGTIPFVTGIWLTLPFSRGQLLSPAFRPVTPQSFPFRPFLIYIYYHAIRQTENTEPPD